MHQAFNRPPSRANHGSAAAPLPGSEGGEGVDRQREDLTRLTVSLPRSLFCRLRLHAADQDSSLSALVVRLIRAELA